VTQSPHRNVASGPIAQKKAFKTFTALPEDLGVLDRNTRTYLIRMAMSYVHTQIQTVALPESEMKVASAVCRQRTLMLRIGVFMRKGVSAARHAQ
jgi:hypothetical protein